MARAESYVLRYSAHTPEQVILAQLRVIDEAIRSRWAENLRTQRATLSSAITDSEPIAAGLWIQAP
eukprot:3282426-Amphidinium_carterae.1